MTKINNLPDCKILQNILLQHGYEASLAECQIMWTEASRACFNRDWKMVPPPAKAFMFLSDYSITFRQQIAMV